jgi:hypothetical protein
MHRKCLLQTRWILLLLAAGLAAGTARAQSNPVPFINNPLVPTGRRAGRPGYVVDHVKPLVCGGADAPSNMQWQTVSEGKAKDKWERKGCK